MHYQEVEIYDEIMNHAFSNLKNTKQTNRTGANSRPTKRYIKKKEKKKGEIAS